MSAGRRTFFLLGLATRPRPQSSLDTTGWPPNPLLGAKRFASQAPALTSQKPHPATPAINVGSAPMADHNDTSLFEDETEEYNVSLPTRSSKSVIPPWPSLFGGDQDQIIPGPGEPSTVTGQPGHHDAIPRRTRYRRPQGPRHTQDLIKYIRYQEDLPTATQILSDLREIGVYIKPSRLYLYAAVRLMQDHARNPGSDIDALKQGILSWLTLAPKVIGSMYSPTYAHFATNFTTILIQTFPSPSASDITFLETVLKDAAEHRSLPVIVNQVLRHLVVVAGPRRSHDLLNELIGIWMREVIQAESLVSGIAMSSSGDEPLKNPLARPADTPATPTPPSLITLSLIKHSNVWRNHYLRSLLLAGYPDEAKSLYTLGEVRGVVWETRTKEKLVRVLSRRNQPEERKAWGLKVEQAGWKSSRPGPGQDSADMAEAESEGSEEVLDTITNVRTSEIRVLLRDHIISPSRAAFERLPLSRKVWKLAHSARESNTGHTFYPVRYLVAVMVDLEFAGRGEGTKLWERLKGRFVRMPTKGPTTLETPSTSAPKKDAASLPAPKEDGGNDQVRRGKMSLPTTATQSYWYFAEVVRQREMGRYMEAVSIFRNRFLWIGLPPIQVHPQEFMRSLSSSGSSEDKMTWNTSRKLYPSRQVITALLPCILSSMPGLDVDGLRAYHTAFMTASSNLPRSKQPDPYSHLAFVRFASRSLKSEQAELFAGQLAQDGYDIGVHGWVAIAVSWIKEGQSDRAIAILDRLSAEAGHPRSHSAQTSDLGPRSFIVPAVTALQRKDKKGAKMILDRLRRRWPKVRVPAIVAEEQAVAVEEEDARPKIRATG